MKRIFLVGLGIVVLSFVNKQLVAEPQAQAAVGHITTPKEFLGFNLGDDYCLANYQQLMKYWAKLEKESDRLKVVNIGTTEEGRPQLMGIVTSPANHKKLDYYKLIARHLALAEGVSAQEADKLAAEGKAVVWIDGGLHASETLCAQVLMETLYQFLAANDSESLRILDDVIILFVHANPDGMDLVADHYMKSAKDPTERSSKGLPRLYEKYAGHDNNRDFAANNLAETKNINRVMYCEWFPQIVYNHHQTAPPGSVVFIPPCRDPFPPHINPLVTAGIEAVSTNMVQRFLSEGKPGVATRTGAKYAAWFTGDLSTTPQYHNMIGIFSETIGGPNPSDTPFMPNRLYPNSDYLLPVTPQKWHFRQSVDYSVSGNKSLLDYASRNREHLLKNIWLMGKNSIDAGSKDSWTITPKMVKAAGGTGGGGGGFKKGSAAGGKEYEKFFHNPANRDPRGYIIPSSQPDFLTATKFINRLLGHGCTVLRAKTEFQVAGKKYPEGSYVVKCAQAFRPHLLEMFEPQEHPDSVPNEDIAGWTLAFLMGVQFDRILEAFDGPFEELQAVAIDPPQAKVQGAKGAVGFFLSPKMNDAFRAVNLLQKAGEEVRRLQEPCTLKGVSHPAGEFFITAKPSTVPVLEKIAKEIGTPFTGSAEAPGKEAVAVKPVRVGLWDSKNGGSMTSGWTRFVLEKFDFPYQLIYNNDLNSDKLNEKFDVLVLVEGALGGGKGGGGGGKGGGKGGGAGEANVKNLKKFIEAGGTIVTIGNSTSLGKQLGLPIESQTAGLSSEKYQVKSSVVRIKVDTNTPLTWGMEENTDVMFSNSPTFKWTEAAAKSSMAKVAWFEGKTPLRSGWARGQQYLDGGVAVIDAKVGQGRLEMLGPQVLFRAQPHGAFKLLFNGIVQAGVKQ